MIIGTYVDDLLVNYKNKIQLDNLLNDLRKHFPVKDAGEFKDFVGIEALHTKDAIKLHQTKYLESVLQRFGYENTHKTATPAIVPTAEASRPSNDDQGQKVNKLATHNMRAIVGALLYLAINTRPDIAYATAILAQTVSTPTTKDYKAAARILRYLHGTRTYGILFQKGIQPTLYGYADADWGSDYSTGKSQSGFVSFFGGPICWNSRKQTTVALSTAESELYAEIQEAQDILWIRSLLQELGYDMTQPTVLYEDNAGALALANNTVIGKRTRHVNIKYHCINDWVNKGFIRLEKVAQPTTWLTYLPNLWARYCSKSLHCN